MCLKSEASSPIALTRLLRPGALSARVDEYAVAMYNAPGPNMIAAPVIYLAEERI